jgi:O-methyltransferase
LIAELIQRLLRPTGYKLTRNIPPDFSSDDTAIVDRVAPYTLTSPERLFACVRAVEYLVANRIPGDVVECGVWKGGSMMAIALTLLRLRADPRELYLFDTFEGMAPPTEGDVDFRGSDAASQLAQDTERKGGVWACAPLDETRRAVLSTGYEPARIHFVKGKVEETLPAAAPAQIGLLRLDTDWYESTRHELVHLFPRLVKGGVIIIDDYGHWQGAKKATDEYLAEHGIALLLNRIDYTGRVGVKI